MQRDPADPNRVELHLAGQIHGGWEQYEIDSDLMTPADAWQVSLGLGPTNQLPTVVTAGQPVEVRIGGELVMTGRIDAVHEVVSKSAHTVRINGRDGAAILVDCSAPVFVAKLATMDEIVAKIVRPLGIAKFRVDSEKNFTREKINVEPGDTAWDVLAHAAEANGLWPWFTPDGTLIVGRPDYAKPPVGSLILRRTLGESLQNNVLSLERQVSVHDRFSEVTVLGQSHGAPPQIVDLANPASGLGQSGKHRIKATVQDTGVTWYRPKIIVDHEADNEAVARARARKKIADSRLSGYVLTALVSGHRVLDDQGAGPLWTPGQRVHVVSEPHGIDNIYFLMSRKFTGGRGEGMRTRLVLKEDAVWMPEAHPHKRKHRRGKNSGPGKVIDL